MPSLNARCARCSHAFSFHGKGFDIPCRAVGCRKTQPDDQPCPGFVDLSSLKPRDPPRPTTAAT